MSDWHDRTEAAEANAMEAMEKLAGAFGGLRTAVAESPESPMVPVAKLDLQRRFAWCCVNDALRYARACLGWEMRARDPLFVHSEGTRRLYVEVHDRGLALVGGRSLEAARNAMMRASRAAERALEDLGVIYDEHLSSPSLYPAVTGPLDHMRELHEAVAGPLPRKAGPSRPRRRSMSQRLASRMRAGRPLRS